MSANYHGPIEVELGEAQGEGPRFPLRFFARTNPGDERVEVELRAGRGGIVFVQPTEKLDETGIDVMPEPDAVAFVLPEARVRPFSVDDFAPRGVAAETEPEPASEPEAEPEDLSEEEAAELAELTRADAADEAARERRSALENLRAQAEAASK